MMNTIDIDIEQLRNDLRETWGKEREKSVVEVSYEIGISMHTFRSFLYGRPTKHTLKTLIKMQDWVNKHKLGVLWNNVDAR